MYPLSSPPLFSSFTSYASDIVLMTHKLGFGDMMDELSRPTQSSQVASVFTSLFFFFFKSHMIDYPPTKKNEEERGPDHFHISPLFTASF